MKYSNHILTKSYSPICVSMKEAGETESGKGRKGKIEVAIFLFLEGEAIKHLRNHYKGENVPNTTPAPKHGAAV